MLVVILIIIIHQIQPASVVHNISSFSATAIKSRKIEKDHKKGRF